MQYLCYDFELCMLNVKINLCSVWFINGSAGERIAGTRIYTTNNNFTVYKLHYNKTIVCTVGIASDLYTVSC